MTWALNRFLRGVGGRWYSTYTAIPHYISSRSRSLFVSSTSYLEFDFTDAESVAVEAVAPDGELAGQIVAGENKSQEGCKHLSIMRTNHRRGVSMSRAPH